jgi:hypothetical protein
MTASPESNLLRIQFFNTGNTKEGLPELQKRVWKAMRSILEQRRFSSIELKGYKSDHGVVLENSPLRMMMIRGQTMPELNLSKVQTTATAEAASTPLRKSPLRSESHDGQPAVSPKAGAANSDLFMTVSYIAPFDVAQQFADQSFSTTASLSVVCRIFYGKRELFPAGNAVARKSSDSQKLQQIAAKNWHEECISNPNSPRFSPRDAPCSRN